MEILKMTTTIWIFIFQFGLPCVQMTLAPWSSRCLWLAAITPLWHHTNIFPLCPAGGHRSNVIICRSCTSAKVCVWQRVINKENKSEQSQCGERAERQPANARMLPFCPLGAQIQVGGHCQAEQPDRILARPVQKIKAGQLALMPALFFCDWRAWRTAGLLFCPVLELLFSGCTNSSSFMVWLENQYSSYALVHKTQEKCAYYDSFK